ncbi:MAG: TIGR01777 family oxidoreductase [Verrucomicrobia bacterium]|nr:TIGR01777 family oxidoreductase [Verrucomicrobiota bacterium]
MNKALHFLLPGGTGQAGMMLQGALRAAGHRVTILSRRPANAEEVHWDGVHSGPWTELLNETDVVINLAGRSVNCRYHPAQRREILESRVLSTRAIGEAIAAARRPPALWLQSSTATIYAHTLGAAHGEDGEPGGAETGVPETWRFSVEVAKAWEAAALDFQRPETRLVLMRTSFIMSPHRGGAFDVFMGLARKGLGGSQGTGRQFVSWIHEVDFTRAIQWMVDKPEFAGPVNLASPYPLPNREFMKDLRAVARHPFGIPAPRWMLEVGAVALGTETELILKSRRVVPTKLLKSGFVFRYPQLPQAMEELAQRWWNLREPSGSGLEGKRR